MSRWKKVHESENPSSEYSDFTHRLAVDGGYLYRSITVFHGTPLMNTCFVPVPKCDRCGFYTCHVCMNCNNELAHQKR